ncbi:MAG: twin-arginine translocase subunit TatC [Pseudomonadota bacterium]
MDTNKNPITETPLIDHLIELRRRLLYATLGFLAAFCIAYYFAPEIFMLLTKPLVTSFESLEGRRLIYTGLTEAFMTYIKVALFAATFISLPIIIIQTWLFIAPGLFSHEKKAFIPFLFAVPILFSIGALFAYFVVIPAAWKFFIQFEVPATVGHLPIQLEARMHEYLALIMQLLLVFGISFQLPIILLLLAKLGVVQKQFLEKKRKYAFLFIMIASAFLTPPDVLSMLLLSLPLYLLYESSLQLLRFSQKSLPKQEYTQRV